MKAKINLNEFETSYSSYEYHRRNVEEYEKKVDASLYVLRDRLQTLVNEKKINLPDGESVIEFGWKVYISVSVSRSNVHSVQPFTVIPIDSLLVEFDDTDVANPNVDTEALDPETL